MGITIKDVDVASILPMMQHQFYKRVDIGVIPASPDSSWLHDVSAKYS